MKRLKSFIAAAFVVAVLSFAHPGLAQDGFTQKDRELLIRLAVKMEEMDKRFEQTVRRAAHGFEQTLRGVTCGYECPVCPVG